MSFFIADVTYAAGLSLGCMGCIESYYGDNQKATTIAKVAFGMAIASAVTTLISIAAKSKNQ